MSSAPHRIAASAVLDAPATLVYDTIANYREHHPRILPPRAFGALEVERGGTGAGTTIRFEMRVLGTRRIVRGEVAEPEPGRILTETYPESGTVTTFVVTPRGGGRSEVEIITEMPATGGLRGRIERWIARRILPPVYREELARLETYARERARAVPRA